MTKNEILELIDKCPYWGEDIESQVMIKDLKKWLEFSIKDDLIPSAKMTDDNSLLRDSEFITRKEFRTELIKLRKEFNIPGVTFSTSGFSTFT